jgi:PRC-barrel domain
MGRSVHSSADPQSDNIGDINDLIIGEDGTITHAVVGVGGFLGIGEKDVAVPFDQLQVVEKNGGKSRSPSVSTLSTSEPTTMERSLRR